MQPKHVRMSDLNMLLGFKYSHRLILSEKGKVIPL